MNYYKRISDIPESIINRMESFEMLDDWEVISIANHPKSGNVFLSKKTLDSMRKKYRNHVDKIDAMMIKKQEAERVRAEREDNKRKLRLNIEAIKKEITQVKKGNIDIWFKVSYFHCNVNWTKKSQVKKAFKIDISDSEFDLIMSFSKDKINVHLNDLIERLAAKKRQLKYGLFT